MEGDKGDPERGRQAASEPFVRSSNGEGTSQGGPVCHLLGGTVGRLRCNYCKSHTNIPTTIITLDNHFQRQYLTLNHPKFSQLL